MAAISSLTFIFLEVQDTGVDAVALACRPRAVIEDVAEVAAAFRARDFCPAHAMAHVLPEFHRPRQSIGKAGPAGAGIELPF